MADQLLAANGEMGSCDLVRPGVLRRSVGFTLSPQSLQHPTLSLQPSRARGRLFSHPAWAGGALCLLGRGSRVVV